MESYVTRREFENVLKEVRRLQFFLADTFGPKFMEFFKEEKFLEAESRLNTELGSFSTNVLNASLKMGITTPPPPTPPPPQSQPVRLSSSAAGVPPAAPPPSSLVLSLPPPVPTLPGARPPISNYNFSMDYRKSVSQNQSAPSARLLITEALQARDRMRLKGYQNQDKILDATRAKLASATPSSSSHSTPLPSPVVPISVVRAYKRKADDKEEDEFEEDSSSSCASPEIKELSSSVGRDILEKECIILEDNDENDSNQRKEMPKQSVPLTESAPPPPKISKPAPLPSFRNSKVRSLDCGGGAGGAISNDEIIQCQECSLYIYKSNMSTHLKTHSLLNGSAKKTVEKDKPSPSSSKTLSSSSPSSFFKQPLHCFLCRQEFATYFLYEDHCDSHHLNRHPCPICLKTLKPGGRLKLHMKAHDNPKCVCTVCGKCCHRPDPLSRHLQSCKVGKPVASFYCTFCDLKFDSRRKRDHHLLSVYGNHYKFKEVCKKVGSESLLSSEDKSPPFPEQKQDNKNVNEVGGGGAGAGNSSVIGVGAGELIDVTTQLKVDVGDTLQFEYEGDDDELI